MKRSMLMLILIWMSATAAWAINDVTLVPSAGMPLITIDGVLSVDTVQVGAGNLISFDLYFRDIDFTFSGCEFRLYHPIFLARYSEDPLHWQTNSDAVFVPGPEFQNGKAMVLPANPDGSRQVPQRMNSYGNFMVGLVFKDGAGRWAGTPQKPHPGGLLGTIRFRFNPVGVPDCTSRIDSVQVGLGPAFNNGDFDYFSDETGTRVPLVSTIPVDAIGLPGLPGHFGNANASVRADADHNGLRNALDALPAALCALNGPTYIGCANGYWVDHLAEFRHVMDFNCDGVVNGLDALGLMLLATHRRHIIQPGPPPQAVGAEFTEDVGVLAFRTYYRPNQEATPTLGNFDDQSWTLIWEASDNLVTLLLVHKDAAANAPFPEILWQGTSRAADTFSTYGYHVTAANQGQEYSAQ